MGWTRSERASLATTGLRSAFWSNLDRTISPRVGAGASRKSATVRASARALSARPKSRRPRRAGMTEDREVRLTAAAAGDLFDQRLDGRLAAGGPNQLQVGQGARRGVVELPLAIVEAAVAEMRWLAAAID